MQTLVTSTVCVPRKGLGPSREAAVLGKSLPQRIRPFLHSPPSGSASTLGEQSVSSIH